MVDYRGKVALVTGAASGIGLAMARAFHGAGMRVAMADRDPDRLAAQAAALGGDVLPLVLDVTDRDAFAAARDRIEAQFGGLNLLCNNAGVGSMAPIEQSTFNDWDWTLGVNLGGVINGVLTFLPLMRKTAGLRHIVNTSSVAGLVPLGGGASVYSVGKQAVRALSEELRGALAREGIGVSALCPGYVATGFFRTEESRPTRFANDSRPAPEDIEGFGRLLDSHGMSADEVARAVIEGVAANRAYILPQPEIRALVEDYGRHLLASIPEEPVDDPLRMESLEMLAAEWHKLKV